MTATLRLADGRPIHAHTQTRFGVNEPNKRNANALKSGCARVSVCVCVRLCCEQWKWKMCLRFLLFRNIEKDLVRVHLLLPAVRFLFIFILFCRILSFLAGASARSLFFFFFEKCSHMLATNARAPADTQPWNWQNDVRCRPLLCHTFRIYIFLFTIVPYANIRTHVFQHDLQPAQISTKRNEIGLFAWIWHKIVNAFRYCDNNALGLVTEVRGRAHGNNNACIHHHQRSHSHRPWYHRAGRRLNKNENNLCRNESVHRWCLSSHVCIAHNWYLLNVFF